jgi:hypothetical protein
MGISSLIILFVRSTEYVHGVPAEVACSSLNHSLWSRIIFWQQWLHQARAENPADLPSAKDGLTVYEGHLRYSYQMYPRMILSCTMRHDGQACYAIFRPNELLWPPWATPKYTHVNCARMLLQDYRELALAWASSDCSSEESSLYTGAESKTNA